MATSETSEKNHYSTTAQKIGDFILGILITIVGGFFVGILIAILANVFSSIAVPDSLAVLIFLLGLLVLIYMIIRFIQSNNRAGRSYVSLGIIASAILPLIIFGACLFTFSSGF